LAMGCAWGLMVVSEAAAQSLRLGGFDINVGVNGSLAYSSNVDGAYPEAVDPDYQEAQELLDDLKAG